MSQSVVKEAGSRLLDVVEWSIPVPKEQKGLNDPLLYKHGIKRIVNKAKHEIDVAPPKTMGMPHILYNAKGLLLEEMKLQNIYEENQYLLDYMRRAMTKGCDLSKIWNRSYDPNRSTQYLKKKRDLLKVARENIRLLKSMQNRKGAELLKKCAANFERHLEVKRLMGRYGNKWKSDLEQRKAAIAVERSVSNVFSQWGTPAPPLPKKLSAYTQSQLELSAKERPPTPKPSPSPRRQRVFSADSQRLYDYINPAKNPIVTGHPMSYLRLIPH